MRIHRIKIQDSATDPTVSTSRPRCLHLCSGTYGLATWGHEIMVDMGDFFFGMVVPKIFENCGNDTLYIYIRIMTYDYNVHIYIYIYISFFNILHI